MLEFLVEFRCLFNGIVLTVNLQPLEALALEIGDFLLVFALTATHERRQQQQARTFRQGHDLVDHL